MEPIDMHELRRRGPKNGTEELRLELYEKVNALGIGAQGLGGLSTVLDVKILDYPTHAASKPVGMIPNCAATRHAHFTLDGSGAAKLAPPDLARWPDVQWAPAPTARRVDLDRADARRGRDVEAGRDAAALGQDAHRAATPRTSASPTCSRKGEGLPPGVDFTNRVIYYVGPVDPVRDEVVGPAGPTTATRMDKFTEMMLAQTGLIAMIGKAERGPVAIEAIRKHRAAYLMAVGGAAYLVSKAIQSSRVVAFGDLGMEAIYEFDVKDMPVTVAVDAQRHLGAPDRPARVAAAHRQDSGDGGMRHPLASGMRSDAHPCGSGSPDGRRTSQPPEGSPRERVRMKLFRQASAAARDGHGFGAEPAAGADGAADEAQPAHHRAHLPHRHRDHRLLPLAAVARREERAAPAQRDVARDAGRDVRVRIAHEQPGLPRGDPRSALPPKGTSRTRSSSTRRREPVAARRIADALGTAGLPALPPDTPLAGGRDHGERPSLTVRGRRYVELIAPVGGAKIASAMGLCAGAAASRPPSGAGAAQATAGADRLRPAGDDVRPPAGAVPQAPGRRPFRHRARSSGSRSARRSCSPAASSRRCTVSCARRARSAPASSTSSFPRARRDELGLLTHTFNHMTQRLSESQAEVGELPAHAGGQGRPAHAGAGNRDRARVQARAARHPDRAAQPGIAQPAAEADPRAVAAQRHARRVPVPRLRPLQAHQRHARPRLGRPAAAVGRAAPHRPPCASPTRSRGWGATSSW